MYTGPDLAKLLVCLLGNDPTPLHSGILDRALQLTCQQKSLPDWAMKILHFAEGRVGLCCVELEQLTGLAYSMGLIEYDSRTFNTMRPLISNNAKKIILRKLNVSETEARKYRYIIAKNLIVAQKERKTGSC